MFEPATFSDLPAFLCGHAQNIEAATGCTAIVAPKGAVCSVDVRGGGPATRETDLLRPENTIENVHAVVLSGGSAFGLAASTGVMEEWASQCIGFELCGQHVPIITGACLFDLVIGSSEYPTAEMGARAVRNAFEAGPNANPEEGNVGAGCGATVGKFLQPQQAMKTGFGVYGLRCGDVVAVALVAVNALGTVCDSAGTPLAGCLDEETGKIMEPLEPLYRLAQAGLQNALESQEGPCPNTTIGVIVTNASITKAQAKKISSIAHDAYARAIKPVHSSADGDTIFTMASGEAEAPFDLVAVLATEAMQKAVERAATEATSSHGYLAHSDIR